MTTGSFVSYLRVSTQKQGKSGLGVEAQRKAVEDYLNGGDWKLLEEFVEVESGKRDDRPQLLKAIEYAELTGATVVIAKLDRLSRDVHFLTGLQKSGVKFVCADMPEANEMTIQIMAVMAEAERKMISQRTKAALAAAKERGVKLGCPNGARHLRKYGNKAAVEAVRAQAENRAAKLSGVIEDIQQRGVTSYSGIAAELNARGIQTPRGGQWYAASVKRLFERLNTGNIHSTVQ